MVPSPVISILLCTYNGKELVRNCLHSILSQSFSNFEVLCIDGMSSDGTRELILEYAANDPRIKLVENKKRLPEGVGRGKWLGFNQSQGKIVGIIDQDNVLQRTNLFSEVVEIFEASSGDLLGLLGGLRHDKTDAPVVRYVSLFGTDAFFAYRSIDFLRTIRKDVELIQHPFGTFETAHLSIDNMSITGGNCFFYLKKISP